MTGGGGGLLAPPQFGSSGSVHITEEYGRSPGMTGFAPRRRGAAIPPSWRSDLLEGTDWSSFTPTIPATDQRGPRRIRENSRFSLPFPGPAGSRNRSAGPGVERSRQRIRQESPLIGAGSNRISRSSERIRRLDRRSPGETWPQSPVQARRFDSPEQNLGAFAPTESAARRREAVAGAAFESALGRKTALSRRERPACCADLKAAQAGLGANRGRALPVPRRIARQPPPSRDTRIWGGASGMSALRRDRRRLGRRRPHQLIAFVD